MHFKLLAISTWISKFPASLQLLTRVNFYTNLSTEVEAFGREAERL